LGNLLDTIEESDVKMTAALHDKMIASKATGKKFTSPINYTIGSSQGQPKRCKRAEFADGQSKGDAAASPALIFQPSNKSAIRLIGPGPRKRQRQAHPGNNDHIPESELTLCEICNHGVKSKVLQCRCVC
jgi:hypothetical protein